MLVIKSSMQSEKRILIIEDHLNAADTLKSNLEALNENLSISILASAEEALLELKLSYFDMVITDTHLPGMSGFELLEIIKRIRPKTKVFIVSDSAEGDIKKKFALAGAEAFFIKPVDIPEFLDAIERSLGFTNTILTPELQLEKDEPEEVKTSGLPRELLTLKRKLNAQAIFLLGKVGQILMSEGKLPKDRFEPNFIPKLFQLIQIPDEISEELQALAHRNLHTFRIANSDIISIQIESSYLLVIVIPKDNFADLSSVYHSTDAINDILKTLGGTTMLDASAIDKLSVNDYKQIENEPETDDALLVDALNFDVRPEDADSFWDALYSQKTTPASDPESISYDQAKDLGVDIPDDQEKHYDSNE